MVDLIKAVLFILLALFKLSLALKHMAYHHILVLLEDIHVLLTEVKTHCSVVTA